MAEETKRKEAANGRAGGEVYRRSPVSARRVHYAFCVAVSIRRNFRREFGRGAKPARCNSLRLVHKMAEGRRQSARAPVAFTTGPHFFHSALMNARNASGAR